MRYVIGYKVYGAHVLLTSVIVMFAGSLLTMSFVADIWSAGANRRIAGIAF